MSEQLLPKHLLARVLQLLDLQQRLGSCALVNRTWCAAAAAASSDLQLTVTRNPQPKQLLQWLSSAQHSSCIQGLTLDSKLAARAGRLNVCLPLQQLPLLRSLDLRRLTLHSSSSPSTAGSSTNSAAAASSNSSVAAANSTGSSSSSSSSNAFAAVAGSLTALRLEAVALSGFPGGLCSLSVLTRLQQLVIKLPREQQQNVQQSAALAAGLGQLMQLTSLRVDSADPRCTGLAAAFAQLQQLQQLRLSPLQHGVSGRRQRDCMMFELLPGGVTLLELNGFGNLLCSQHTWLAPLPLQHVQLRNTLVGDCLCTHMSGLTSLVVGFVKDDAHLLGFHPGTAPQPFTDMWQHATRLQHSFCIP
jgi:hypothetical protein